MHVLLIWFKQLLIKMYKIWEILFFLSFLISEWWNTVLIWIHAMLITTKITTLLDQSHFVFMQHKYCLHSVVKWLIYLYNFSAINKQKRIYIYIYGTSKHYRASIVPPSREENKMSRSEWLQEFHYLHKTVQGIPFSAFSLRSSLVFVLISPLLDWNKIPWNISLPITLFQKS